MNTLSEEIQKRFRASPGNLHPIMQIAALIRITVEVTREFERTDPASVEAFLLETKPGGLH
jgi:hypothetical protein